jgi:hypothetical protein
VRVDEAGENDAASGVVGRLAAYRFARSAEGPDGEDLAVLDRERARVVERELLVHRHEAGVDDEEVGGVFLRGGGGDEERRE